MKSTIFYDSKEKAYITKKLQGDLSGRITLLQVPLERSLSINVLTLQVLQLMGYEGVYICLSYPAVELTKVFQKEDLNTDKIFFLDGISKMYATKELNKNAEYILSPKGTGIMSSALTKVLSEMKSEKRFVFLDSITTVLLYNSFEDTIEFSNFITQTLQKEQILGVVISVSRGPINNALFSELRKISNEVIVLDE